ncbi:MAG: toll/interleukin-1 receptor domain-containing protein [Acidobacteriia bacterium]|nr:toll/interleukin-1 receptor domain-containing protein [Terriglobia bacterium]
MALANAGCLLARGAGRVLLMDWDLEAPGLHRFFPKSSEHPEHASRPGIINYFHALESFLSKSKDLYDEISQPTGWRTLGNILPLDRYLVSDVRPNVDLMKAGSLDPRSNGNLDADYARLVSSFHWASFYAKYPAIFVAFRSLVTSHYDYCLVDSRTGITDVSGICTTLLPEKLVGVFTPNRQSLYGLLQVIDEVLAYRKTSDDFRPLSVFPLPSRIDINEKILKEQWRLEYQKNIETLFCKAYGLAECDMNEYFDEVQLPYLSYYSYGENVAVLEERPDALSLSRAYQAFVTKLIESELPWKPIPIDQERRLRVFISYASPDKDDALRLCDRLIVDGIRPWIDDTDILPGESLQQSIANAIRESDVGVICMSSKSRHAPNDVASASFQAVRRLGESLDSFKIVPVRFDKSDLPDWLQNRQSADLFEPDGYSKLLTSLRSIAKDIGAVALPDEASDSEVLALATRYRNEGKFGDAEALYKRAIETNEKTFGRDHLSAVTFIKNLANLCADQGRLVEAESLYCRVVMILEKNPALGGISAIDTMESLALVYRSQGKYAEAEAIYLRVLDLTTQTLSKSEPGLASILNRTVGNLATIYRIQGRFQEWESLYHRVIAVKTQVFGSEHPEIAITLNRLGVFLRMQKRYNEAEVTYKKSLRIAELSYGNEHPEVTAILTNLAMLLRVQARYAEAEALLKQALSIKEKTFGPDHPDIANTLNSLASTCQREGRYDEAEMFYRRALKIKEAALSPSNPDISNQLFSLASLYLRAERYLEAEPLLVRALELKEKTFGSDHPDVVASMNSLAGIYALTGRFSEAELLLERALSIRQRALGAEHPRTASSLARLASLYRQEHLYRQAEPLYLRALEIRTKVLGADHVQTLHTLKQLAGCYRELGRNTEAETLLLRGRLSEQ